MRVHKKIRWGEYGWTWVPVDITGRWKIIKELDRTILFLEIKGFIFRYWESENNIELFEGRKEYINKC